MSAGYLALGRPDWSRPRLAPDGDLLAAVHWHDGAPNVWVGTSKIPMKLVTDLAPGTLRDFCWSADGSGLILVLQDPVNSARWLAWLDLSSGTLTRLTPEHVADAHYAGQLGRERPGVMVAVRNRRTRNYQLQAITPAGEVIAEWQGPGPAATRWLATATHAVVVCANGNARTWWHSRLDQLNWSRIAEIPAADSRSSRPVAISADGAAVVALSSRGRDTLALIRLRAPDWSESVIAASEQFDVTSVLTSAQDAGPELVTTTEPGGSQSALTRRAAAELNRLGKIAAGAPARIAGRNRSHCLAEICFPVGGPSYLAFSRTTGEVSTPLARYTSLAGVRIRSRAPFRCQARDGLSLTGFLTCPDVPPPWPAVLVVHGGPWSMDDADMDPWAQQLAAAGLCCIQVNYRGSRGFGKRFRAAGDRQWSLAMQDDLVDALRSAPVSEVADLSRVAAMGYGYGGYAALMLATQAEIPLAGVISASAPTDLVRHVTSLRTFGGPAGFEYATRIGHAVRDRDQLAAASPVNRVADIGSPVRLFHGQQDVRIPVSHATMFADALRRTGTPCELTIYDNEGHRYARPQNLADFRARSLDFLRGCLNVRVGSGVG